MKKLLSTTIAALSIAMVSQADFSQFVMQQDMLLSLITMLVRQVVTYGVANGLSQILELMLVLAQVGQYIQTKCMGW